MHLALAGRGAEGAVMDLGAALGDAGELGAGSGSKQMSRARGQRVCAKTANCPLLAPTSMTVAKVSRPSATACSTVAATPWRKARQ